MEQARKNAIAQMLIERLENDQESAAMMARVSRKCGDESAAEANQKLVVNLEKKIVELRKEIVEEPKKEGE